MRRSDIQLRYMAHHVVVTCIVLHNMCTIRRKKIDIERIEEAKIIIEIRKINEG